LWFGWYGFNPGSAYLYADGQDGDLLAALAATNTTLAGGAAGLSTLFVNYFVHFRLTGKGKYKLVDTMNGVLSGLVAVTAPCCVIEPWAAVIIGSVAGLVYLFMSWALIQVCLDDAVDAIPVHMFNGIWGLMSVGIFASPKYLVMCFGARAADHPGLVYSGVNGRPSGHLLASQMVGILFCAAWPVSVMFPFFVYLEQIGSFRVSAREEVSGLDKEYFTTGQNEADVDQDQIAQLTNQVEEQLRRRRVTMADDVPKTIGSTGHTSLSNV
jgi:ammonium transporter, Amt family